MIQIAYDEFMKYLLNSDRAIHGELLPNCYCKYKSEFSSDESSSLFYYTNGCAIHFSPSDTGVFVFIHQVSDNMRLSETVSMFSERMNAYAESYAIKSRYMFAFVKPDEAKEYDSLVSKYHYARISEQFPSDPHIKKISKDNTSEITEMCEPYLENDTAYGKILARIFYENSIYEENLIGL